MEEYKIIYSMDRVGKVVPPNREILRDISLGYYYGAKIGVIGLNGSGKSTLLKIMAGIDTDYLGRVAMAKGFTIGYLEQDPKLDPERTVLDIVREGAANTVALLARFDEVSMRLGEPIDDEEMNKLLDEQGNLQDQLDACDAWDLDSRLELAMDSLRCPPPEMKCGVISGGEKRRVALCRLLIQQPDILLLDEPTNHLDAETIQWLERHLHQYPGTVISVTHDRYFLDNVAGWILELDRGYGIPWKGNYSSWLEQKTQQLAVEEKRETHRQRVLTQELEWIRSTPKAKHQRNKARITQYNDLLSQEYQQRNETNDLYLPAGPRLGDVVVRAEGLSKAFGDNLLFDGLSFNLPPGGIVGVIGANGAGKTTLFRLITSQEAPDVGTITIGETVKISYVDQSRLMDEGKSLVDLLGDGLDIIRVGEREMNVRQYLARFNFAGNDFSRPVKELSGGEKNRVFLALALKQGGNLLLLDEPTNDLDVNTIRALEEALNNFAGCAVVISHDRYFLDRVCTHILAFEGDSHVRWYDGNFSEYEEARIKELGDKALRPHRIVYRKLKR